MDQASRLILLGPPGVGKGTLAVKLSAILGVAHISTGDMFRDNFARGTELGKTAQKYMAAGDLVPDELVLDMVRDRLSQDDASGGFLLDGFPRTIAQAEGLELMLADLGRPVQAVVDLFADEDILIRRLSGRRVCKACGATYHVDNKPPAKEGVCDTCSGEVVQRGDDQPEAIKRRLVEYTTKTQVLTDYYNGKGLLKAVDATGTPEEVCQRVEELLKEA